MSKLTDELRQHALGCATEIQRENPDSPVVVAAYARVKTFAGEICPVCWVTEERNSPLAVETYGAEINCYRCEVCGFGGPFPKSDQQLGRLG